METIGADLNQMQRTPLAAAHCRSTACDRRLRPVRRRHLHLAARRTDRLFHLYRGRRGGGRESLHQRASLPRTLGPTQFLGEISFLNGGAWSMPMREPCDQRAPSRCRGEAMLTLMSASRKCPTSSLPCIPRAAPPAREPHQQFAVDRRRPRSRRTAHRRLCEPQPHSLHLVALGQ